MDLTAIILIMIIVGLLVGLAWLSRPVAPKPIPEVRSIIRF